MTTSADAKHHAIVIGFEAMRICIFGQTEKANPKDVLRWMRLMLKQNLKERK